MHGKRGGVALNTALAVILALIFLAVGAVKAAEVKKREEAILEALKAAQLIKNEIRYKRAPFWSICETVEKSGFKYITAQDGKIAIDCVAGGEASGIFSELFDSVGISDFSSQLELCEECCERLAAIYSSVHGETPGKIKVYAALGVFAALSVFIIAV